MYTITVETTGNQKSNLFREIIASHEKNVKKTKDGFGQAVSRSGDPNNFHVAGSMEGSKDALVYKYEAPIDGWRIGFGVWSTRVWNNLWTT